MIKSNTPLQTIPQPVILGSARQLTWTVARDSVFSDTVGVQRNLWKSWICPRFNSMCLQTVCLGRLLKIPFSVAFLLHRDPQKSAHKTNKPDPHMRGFFFFSPSLQLLMVAQLLTCQSITTEIVWGVFTTLEQLLLSDTGDWWHFGFRLSDKLFIVYLCFNLFTNVTFNRL